MFQRVLKDLIFSKDTGERAIIERNDQNIQKYESLMIFFKNAEPNSIHPTPIPKHIQEYLFKSTGSSNITYTKLLMISICEGRTGSWALSCIVNPCSYFRIAISIFL